MEDRLLRHRWSVVMVDASASSVRCSLSSALPWLWRCSPYRQPPHVCRCDGTPRVHRAGMFHLIPYSWRAPRGSVSCVTSDCRVSAPRPLPANSAETRAAERRLHGADRSWDMCEDQKHLMNFRKYPFCAKFIPDSSHVFIFALRQNWKGYGRFSRNYWTT